MTDNATVRRPSRLDQIKGLVADLARPFAIISTSAASSWAIVDIGRRVNTGEGGALFIGVVMGGLTALYAGKVYENTRIAGQNAEVEKVRATQNPPPTSALQPAEAALPLATDGELPLDQRVQP